MAHRRYLVLLREANLDLPYLPLLHIAVRKKQACGTGVQCLYEKNQTEHRLWEETLVSGIGQDGLWHFACDDSPFAYIMQVASASFFSSELFFFFFFITIKAVLDCLNLQRGID